MSAFCAGLRGNGLRVLRKPVPATGIALAYFDLFRVMTVVTVALAFLVLLMKRSFAER